MGYEILTQSRKCRGLNSRNFWNPFNCEGIRSTYWYEVPNFGCEYSPFLKLALNNGSIFRKTRLGYNYRMITTPDN